MDDIQFHHVNATRVEGTGDALLSLDMNASSTIVQLLQTNDPPPNELIPGFRSLRMHHSMRLKGLESKIQSYESTLKSLYVERDQLLQSVADISTVMNPCRRLPADILIEIFRWTTDSAVSPNLARSVSLDDQYETRRAVTHVCSRWRNIAVDLPILWTSMYIRLNPGHFLSTWKCRRTQYFLGLYLHRACRYNHGLHVSFSCHDTIPEFHPILQILMPTSRQWKTLVLDVQPSSLMAFSPLRGDLPRLSSLHLLTTSSLETYERGHYWMFQYCPALQRISIGTADARCFELPFAQITEFSATSSDGVVSPSTIENALALLAIMPSLRSFTARVSMENREPPAVQQRVQAVCLVSLTITAGAEVGTLAALLSYLDLPSLEYLTLFGAVSVEALLGLAKRSSPPMKRLIFRSEAAIDSFVDTKCLSLLRAFNDTIIYLIVRVLGTAGSRGVLTEQFIQAWEEAEGKSPIAPNLRRLTFVEEHPSLPSDIVDRMAQIRPSLLLSVQSKFMETR